MKEKSSLAHSEIKNLSLIKRRMGGLPYHVKAIARYMISNGNSNNPSPLKTDTHNGSWYAKQSAKCPGINHLDDVEKREAWYRKNARYGLVVPVLILNMEGSHIELDSIDMVNQDNTQLHLNKNGWFANTGECISSTPLRDEMEAATALSVQNEILLRPSKAIMTAAVATHGALNPSVHHVPYPFAKCAYLLKSTGRTLRCLIGNKASERIKTQYNRIKNHNIFCNSTAKFSTNILTNIIYSKLPPS